MVIYSFYYYFLILVEVTWTEQYDLNIQGSKRAGKWLEKIPTFAERDWELINVC